MNITYNNQPLTNQLITFTNIPNIIKIDNKGSGTKAILELTISSLNLVDESKEYYINVNNNKIISTTVDGNDINRYFYLTSNNTIQRRIDVTTSITQALRNCPQLEASYNISQLIDDKGILTNVVRVEAKEVGERFNLWSLTNLPIMVLTPYSINGTSTDDWMNYPNSKIFVDIYKQNGERIGSQVKTLNEYVTTIEKNYYKDNVYFNISPILTSLTEYEQVTPYKIVVYNKINSYVNTLAISPTQFSTFGYMTNQGVKYITSFNSLYLAQNVSRGNIKQQYNKTILYTYEPSVTFSLYLNGVNTRKDIVIKYLSSSFKEQMLITQTFQLNNNLNNITINLDKDLFDKASYIDLVIPDLGTIRYDVIKPIKAASMNQRIFFHNSYGGISFFDFTSSRTEDHKSNIESYTKSLMKYYEEDGNESTIVFDKTTDVTVKLKSHLIKGDARWIFNDLLNSYDCWSIINGSKEKIIITDVKVSETDINDVWEAEVTYTYSLNESFN